MIFVTIIVKIPWELGGGVSEEVIEARDELHFLKIAFARGIRCRVVNTVVYESSPKLEHADCVWSVTS